MKKINLRELYPDAYTTDFFVNVTEDVLETIRASERAEAAYERKMYRYKAQYSLDCENGIENTVLTKPQTPEMVLEEKQLQKQVYFRHSCTFCTPHFFYIAAIENHFPILPFVAKLPITVSAADFSF